jgi:hypothetical protein
MSLSQFKIKEEMKGKTLLMIILVPLLTGCTTWDSSLQILNKSKRTIVYMTSLDSTITRFAKAEFYLGRPIFPDSVQRATMFYVTWDFYADSSYNGKLNLWFFDIDTIKKYMDMDYIVRKNLFVKKKEISKAELAKRKYIITFF